MKIQYFPTEGHGFIRAVQDYIKQNLGEKIMYGKEIRIDSEEIKSFLMKYDWDKLEINENALKSIEAILRYLSVEGNGAVKGKGLWNYNGAYLVPTELFKDAVFLL